MIYADLRQADLAGSKKGPQAPPGGGESPPLSDPLSPPEGGRGRGAPGPARNPFGEEQPGARAEKQQGFDKGSSFLERSIRSILADASVRRRVCGNRACATAWPSGQIRAVVAVCGGARGSNLAKAPTKYGFEPL